MVKTSAFHFGLVLSWFHFLHLWLPR
jgi:hypothetical protein